MKTVSLIAISLFPILATVIAVMFLLPDVVPIHIDFQGNVRYGSKFEALIVGGVLTVACLICSAGYLNIEKLHALGLAHGTVKGSRIVLLLVTIFCSLITLLILIFFLSPL